MHELTSDELSRYNRHILLPQIGEEGQARLKKAKILVIGTGGLGSPVSLYLTAAGIGTIGLAEFDKVEVHNLQRQVLFTENDIGKSKLERATERLLALNPNLNCIQHPKGITPDNALEIFSQYDVLVEATDNLPTRYLNNDAAVLTQKPLIYGSLLQFEGQVSVFAPHLGGACYRCLFPKMPKAGEVPKASENGVFGALCGTIGSLQAMEAIKLITGVGKPLLNRLLVIDALTMQFRTINIKPDTECPVCGSHSTITEINPSIYRY
jgi:adenylyltransferase/sulfurtransferase